MKAGTIIKHEILDAVQSKDKDSNVEIYYMWGVDTKTNPKHMIVTSKKRNPLGVGISFLLFEIAGVKTSEPVCIKYTYMPTIGDVVWCNDRFAVEIININQQPLNERE